MQPRRLALRCERKLFPLLVMARCSETIIAAICRRCSAPAQDLDGGPIGKGRWGRRTIEAGALAWHSAGAFLANNNFLDNQHPRRRLLYSHDSRFDWRLCQHLLSFH